MTNIIQPQDARGFFMLPQAPEDAGYYVYGTPSSGAAHFAHPTLLSLILVVEREWQMTDNRKFGVGNISVANGLPFGHQSHKKGLEVDVRPLRKDGLPVPVYYTDLQYDRAATSRLIELFRTNSAGSIRIFFNDTKILGVTPRQKHDNHFHFQFN
jgi:hypothetical protein